MIREKGRIINILSEHQIQVEVEKNPACLHCAASCLCRFDSSTTALITATLDPKLAAKKTPQKGQEVFLEVPSSVYLKASFLVYMLPVFGLIAGILLGKWLSENFHFSGNPIYWQMGIGLLTLLLTFLGIYLYNCYLRKKGKQYKYMPQIIELVDLTDPQT